MRKAEIAWTEEDRLGTKVEKGRKPLASVSIEKMTRRGIDYRSKGAKAVVKVSRRKKGQGVVSIYDRKGRKPKIIVVVKTKRKKTCINQYQVCHAINISV